MHKNNSDFSNYFNNSTSIQENWYVLKKYLDKISYSPKAVDKLLRDGCKIATISKEDINSVMGQYSNNKLYLLSSAQLTGFDPGHELKQNIDYEKPDGFTETGLEIPKLERRVELS